MHWNCHDFAGIEREIGSLQLEVPKSALRTLFLLENPLDFIESHVSRFGPNSPSPIVIFAVKIQFKL
jgi:hypothetical protein